MTTQSSAKDTKSVSDALNKAETAINKGEAKKPAKTPAKAEKQPSDAELLKAYVNKNKLALEKNGKTYLLAEAWQFVAMLKDIIPSFESASDIVDTVNGDGKKVRYLAVTTTCILKDKKTLQEVSRSTIVATSLEQFLHDKPAYAVWGMSETRALSRAIRNIYGYIARDAGYQATPWEEIQ